VPCRARDRNPEVGGDWPWRGLLPSCRQGQQHDDPFIGVEGFVTDQHIGLHVRQQMIGADQIMRLTAGEEEVDGVAQRIDQGMDLGAQSAARATDRLVLADFFWAPALC
jgi:hypothetical protein